MRRNGWIWAIICALLLSGCQLAQPEAEGVAEDRFCGFYAVPFRWNLDGTMSENFYDNPYLTVYGQDSLDLGDFGSFSIDREVLFAEKEAGGHRVVFPGMPEGYSLFYYTYEDENGLVDALQSDMGPGEEGTHIKVTDEGQEVSISGVIYCGPPVGAPDNWLESPMEIAWMTYRVWETADGRIYLDGSGNSYSAAGFTMSENHSWTYTENGETVKNDSVTVKVSFKTVPRLERLTVYQYDRDNKLLRADEVALEEQLPAFACLPETAWVVVEEVNAEGTVHTAYDLTEEGISHGVVLLDEAGKGSYTQLEISV